MAWRRRHPTGSEINSGNHALGNDYLHLANGSVRHLAAGMSPHVWWALVTPVGGEVVEP